MGCLSSTRILFIIKKHSYGSGSSGLVVSARKLSSALRGLGAKAKIAFIDDSNDIDAAVVQYNPTHVIIEAIWVIPSKFKELIKLHPDTKWTVRNHSRIPFLATEGQIMDWMAQYNELSMTYKNFCISSNNKQTNKTFLDLYGKDSSVYLPNIYILDGEVYKNKSYKKPGYIDIGGFGSARILKNQLIQAVSAIRFANKYGLILRFHINGEEDMSNQIIKNLVGLFKHTKHILIFHGWLPQEEFLQLISTMDLGMQVSLTESFNIVTADFISQNIPIVVSDAIDWMPDLIKAKATNSDDIIKKLKRAYDFSFYYRIKNRRCLSSYNKTSLKAWEQFLCDKKGDTLDVALFDSIAAAAVIFFTLYAMHIYNTSDNNAITTEQPNQIEESILPPVVIHDTIIIEKIIEILKPVKDDVVANAGKIIIAKKGDTLWDICIDAYGDGTYYHAVSAANNIEDPDLIYPNQKIYLPEI